LKEQLNKLKLKELEMIKERQLNGGGEQNIVMSDNDGANNKGDSGAESPEMPYAGSDDEVAAGEMVTDD
jgi:hypothetical protein